MSKTKNDSIQICTIKSSFPFFQRSKRAERHSFVKSINDSLLNQLISSKDFLRFHFFFFADGFGFLSSEFHSIACSFDLKLIHFRIKCVLESHLHSSSVRHFAEPNEKKCVRIKRFMDMFYETFSRIS